MSSQDHPSFTEEVARIEEFVRAVERSADPAASENVRHLVRSILDLHRAGLTSLLDLIAQAGEPGRGILDACLRDELVRNLLLLHDLHPVDLETRVRQALARLAPILLQHGGRGELVAVAGGVVRLRMHWLTPGPALSLALKNVIEGAILEATPDAERVEFEEAPRDQAGRPPTISLPLVGETSRRAR